MLPLTLFPQRDPHLENFVLWVEQFHRGRIKQRLSDIRAGTADLKMHFTHLFAIFAA